MKFYKNGKRGFLLCWWVKTKSAPLPERPCERIAYCAILLTVYEADYSVVVAQSEGADHCYYSTPEMQNILLQNAVSHAVRKAKILLVARLMRFCQVTRC
ncbi:hypothetical protein ACM66K_16995 [Escherichia coli]